MMQNLNFQNQPQDYIVVRCDLLENNFRSCRLDCRQVYDWQLSIDLWSIALIKCSVK